MVDPADALPGPRPGHAGPAEHFVNGHPLTPPFPDGLETAVFGMGCFWGAERSSGRPPGVYTTAVGYAGGYTPNPTYEEVCSGRTGHTEAVLVVFDPARSSLRRSCSRCSGSTTTRPRACARATTSAPSTARPSTTPTRRSARPPSGRAKLYQERAARGRLRRDHHRDRPAPGRSTYAEDYHQQYLAKNPGGYCGLGGTGVSCPIGLASAD